MFGVTICEFDVDGVLQTELQQLLTVLGAIALRSNWKIEGVEANGGTAAERLEQLSDASSIVDGSQLLELASGTSQIVDGQFSAYEEGIDTPWVVIRAVDSSAIDVTSDRIDVVTKVKNAFDTAVDIPGMEPRQE